VDWTGHISRNLPDLQLNWGIDITGGWRERSFRFDQIQPTKVSASVIPFVEWKPRRDLSLHFEIDNATGGGLLCTLAQFGVRGRPRPSASSRIATRTSAGCSTCACARRLGPSAWSLSFGFPSKSS
jgi:hypothetical protein